jgi:hypothetical protein
VNRFGNLRRGLLTALFFGPRRVGFVIDGFKQPLMIEPAYPFQDARNRNPLSPVTSKNVLEYNLICEQNYLYITARIIKKIYDEGSSFGRSQGRSKGCAALPPALILKLRVAHAKVADTSFLYKALPLKTGFHDEQKRG